ncbi:MAG: hypothetical protein A2504_10245 [Bdellovibrionales bacterium RIFOXYD12_FULL_39_22]|nr:MAG: hypothetical protein A2385_15045 [Bdellovibrionales bacterium RIFOXYB1_FULL_39_21]OFZ46181.1 MAG: hypothetical protein A2404_01185 [Bdellovibrionales bacterium RIFOXYC1_FULL_39_130]OFZ74689.1 MAG: hypothetical protein A2560_10710 [Bdellovibrionales bacterium RIFOXYD1_FULL_39_84]OFZ94506.1 MAG: hypothetical protein A2504_10245 [Bdellovibrionales bacterium RIFOXYD12_FULL_39_22]
MKIKLITLNKRKKVLEIVTRNDKKFSLPLAKILAKTSDIGQIEKCFIDHELGNEGITIVFSNGKETSVLLDQFLDYNSDPDYVNSLRLHELSIKAREAIDESGLSRREVARRLKTSPAQLLRLLDQTNYNKSINSIFAILDVLGKKIEINIGA